MPIEEESPCTSNKRDTLRFRFYWYFPLFMMNNERYPNDVFISLQVGSMKPSALILKKALEDIGLKVWICVEMVGGDDFRDEIVRGLKSSKVFLPLINQAWALSGECKDEFNLAKRLNLTSHEKGLTQRNQERMPIIIPIAFSDLLWDDHPHVELLAASVNFIVHPTENLLTGTDETIKSMTQTMKDKGFAIKIPKAPLAEGIKSDMQRALIAPVQERPALQFVPVLEKGKKYFGIQTERGLINGSWNWVEMSSLELTITNATASGSSVTGLLEKQTLRHEVNGSVETSQTPPLPNYMVEWMEGLSHLTEHFVGTYDPVTGKLHVISDCKNFEYHKRAKATLYVSMEYTMVVFDGYVAGLCNDASGAGEITTIALYQF
jgi:hypothetical protein